MSDAARTALIALGVALLVVVLVPLLWTGGMMGGGMMGQPSSVMRPGWLVVTSTLLAAVGVILLLVWGFRRLENRGTGSDEETPLAILQRRYARGEVGPEEYERVRADLLRDRSVR